jgi:putative heme iron utilization protein
MIKMLARETLSSQKQAALAALEKHPGWTVVKEDFCPTQFAKPQMIS